MPFIGNQPALSYTSFAKQDFTTSATTSYTLDNPVTNENEIALFINFVRQEPTTAYTASGTSLTLTSATSASDDMYCVFLGKAVQTINPPSGSVGTAQIANDAVTKDKLSAHNYPAFEAFLTSDQTVSDATLTKCQVNSEIFDTDNCYDNSTNYRFTPNVAGRYNVYGALHFEADADNRLAGVEIAIYKNGSIYSDLPIQFYTNYEKKMTPFISSVIYLNGSSDYVELYGWNNVTTGTATFGGNSSVAITYFGAYRIGD